MEQENGASSTEDIQEEVEKVRKSQHLILNDHLIIQRFYFIESSVILWMVYCILVYPLYTQISIFHLELK